MNLTFLQSIFRRYREVFWTNRPGTPKVWNSRCRIEPRPAHDFAWSEETIYSSTEPFVVVMPGPKPKFRGPESFDFSESERLLQTPIWTEQLMNLSVDVVIACKGRLHHLKRTLPNFLNQDFGDYGVIVVDYGCPDGTFDYVRELNHPRLRCIRVEDDTELFSLPRAINIGVNFSRADVIAKVDADQLVEPDWLRTQIESLGSLGIVRPAVAGSLVTNGDSYAYHGELSQAANTYPGYCLTRQIFHAVRGIDEGFEGWGYEDVDLCFRVLRRQKLDYTPFVPYRGAFLNHSDDDSVRFYTIKNKEESAAKNLARLQCYDRPINPVNYGRSVKYQLFQLLDIVSAAGAWNEYYRENYEQTSYGSIESYQLPGIFLAGLREVEDWGCGLGYFQQHLPGTHYIGIDGSPNPYVATVTDLRTYTSSAEGILLRHVLDHNWCWEQILLNAISSFQKQLVIVIWLPMTKGETIQADTNFLGIPDLRIPADRLEELLGNLWFQKHICASGETIYFIRKS